MGIELGQYIKTIRKNQKMSVKDLSETAGISKSYMDYIESGAREPQVEMLAKIAAVLQIPLVTLLDIQKKEQLQSAITKLRTEGVTHSEDEIRAVARTANDDLTVDEQALAQTQEAFRTTGNPALLADYIANQDLRAIVKAGATLTEEDLEKLRKVMESLYPDAFKE